MSVMAGWYPLCFIWRLPVFQYGTQLRDNYKGSTSYSEQLRGIEDDSPYSTLEEGSAGTARVAMDFTGPGGRVVEDPTEAQAVAIAEVHHWRVSSLHTVCSPVTPFHILESNAIQHEQAHEIGHNEML